MSLSLCVTNLTALEAGSPRSWHGRIWYLVKDGFMGQSRHLLAGSSRGILGLGGLWGLLHQALIPFVRGPPSWASHLPQALLPHPITPGFGFQCTDVGGPNTQSRTAGWTSAPRTPPVQLSGVQHRGQPGPWGEREVSTGKASCTHFSGAPRQKLPARVSVSTVTPSSPAELR